MAVSSVKSANTTLPPPESNQMIWEKMDRSVQKMMWRALDPGLKLKCDNTFQSVQRDSLQKLKEACKRGSIKDFLQCLIMETGMVKGLGVGNFRLKFLIYKILHRKYQFEGKEKWNLFVKELDPSELLKDLMHMSVFGEKDKVNVNLIQEEQQMEFMIGRILALKGVKKGFEILMDHCKRFNYKHILKENAKQELYTANAILSICRKESTGAMQENSVPHSELCIDSLHIQDPKTYFDTNAEDVDDADVDKDQIVMELTPACDTTEEETVQRNPHLPEVDNSVGANIDGDHMVIYRSPIENPTNPIISVVNGMKRCIDESHSYIQEFANFVEQCTGNCDQEEAIPQSMELVCEELHKRIKTQDEIEEMVQQLTEDLSMTPHSSHMDL